MLTPVRRCEHVNLGKSMATTEDRRGHGTLYCEHLIDPVSTTACVLQDKTPSGVQNSAANREKTGVRQTRQPRAVCNIRLVFAS
jgi:hypothetical protein